MAPLRLRLIADGDDCRSGTAPAASRSDGADLRSAGGVRRTDALDRPPPRLILAHARSARILLSELRRRGVIRTGAVFLAGAWLAIEVADTVFPRLGLPDWGVTALVWSGVLGFPAVIALAWVFDLGPGGLRRDRIVRSPRALVPALVVLTAVLGLGAWVAWLRPDRMAAVPLDEGMVAVLPFRTAGVAGDLGWLREGLVDALHTKLTGEVGPRAVHPATVMSAWRGRALVDPGSATRFVRRVPDGSAILPPIRAAGIFDGIARRRPPRGRFRNTQGIGCPAPRSTPSPRSGAS